MQNPLVKVMSNQVVNKVVGEASKFYALNKSTILSVGGIGFSVTATGIALRNGAEINRILIETREAIWNCNTKEEKNQVYTLMLKELAPLIAPIIIFEGLTIGCIVLNKKHSDKLEAKLAETAGALSIAQTAIAQYQSFQKEAEQALGEEKVHDIQKEIAENTVYEVSACPVNTKQTDDDQIVYEPITGQIIWSTPDRLNLAWEKYKSEVKDSENHFVPVGQIFFERIGADARTASAEVFGYYNEDASKMSDSLYLDTTKVIVNGKEMAALKINYYPSIKLVTDEVFD